MPVWPEVDVDEDEDADADADADEVVAAAVVVVPPVPTTCRLSLGMIPSGMESACICAKPSKRFPNMMGKGDGSKSRYRCTVPRTRARLECAVASRLAGVVRGKGWARLC